MISGLSIRRAARSELDGILALAHGQMEAPQWPRQEYERILLAGEQKPSQSLALQRLPLVAELSGALAGFAVTSFLRGEQRAVLETLIVDRNCRRRGLGTELLSFSMLTAQKAGASAISLEVRESNAAALALYLRRGFGQTGRRKAYYSNPVEDALLLEASLRYVQAGLPGVGPEVGPES